MMITTTAENGMRKWSEKNRLRVGWDTEKLPHIHFTLLWPMYGIAEKMLVMTVAPQNDICPHGSTYPKKADAINRTRIVIPLVQVWLFFEGDLLCSPRAICVNRSMNRTEAKLICMNRLIHPLHEFRIIESVEVKASIVLLMYLMDRISPVTSWTETTDPSRNPEFHNEEMLGGVGKSVIDLFSLFMMFSFFFIF